MRPIGMGCVLLAGATLSATPGEEGQPTTVAWSRVQEAIATTICVIDAPSPSGHGVSRGERKPCGLPPAADALDTAVEAAFKSAAPLMMTVKDVFSASPEGMDAAYAAKEPAERGRLAAAALLAYEPFLRALVPRVEQEMERRGLACDGCPKFSPIQVRRMTWSEFSPYVSAFVLPHPDLKGFHVCSGLDAAKHVDKPDRGLLRAGLVTAFQCQATFDRTGEVLGEARQSPAFAELASDEARGAFLHKAVVERFRSDPELRGQACAALRRYGADLGVELSDCDVEAETGADPARNAGTTNTESELPAAPVLPGLEQLAEGSLPVELKPETAPLGIVLMLLEKTTGTHITVDKSLDEAQPVTVRGRHSFREVLERLAADYDLLIRVDGADSVTVTKNSPPSAP